ncbi:YbhB/YbcL family Raf kinase inhibitor-like protein [Actinomyces vulturis]|uniref:YbhB/YbcL family Raf kinase inhibitor-like protein n=1 Tax=Actinomyces vulturis TaxID=1857645 RepID=UPI00083763FA|nr:YbhB/YbcL family Raf kinase inhibitor-like protein [Actinomyces vulturis]
MNITRPQAPFPYDLMPQVPSFTLTSPDLTDGQPMDSRFTQIHDNLSPALEWNGFPEETQSFVVSCFDPDAPTPSGWWHWTVLDIPVTMTRLEQGAGTSDLTLEGPAFHLRNDSREWAWSGPYPPAGDGPHRYVFAVHALDVESLELDDETPATEAAAHISFHCLARAILTATYEVPA